MGVMDDRDKTMTTAGIGPMSTVELFEQAVRAHSARLISIARAIVGNRASPEDVVQQAVMNLFKHRDRYDWREPGGLLKRATINEALRLLRRPRMGSVTEETDVRSAELMPDEAMETNETVQKVRAAIQQLPEHFRAALVLCEYENMSYQQIAETLNCSVPQVKTWIHRARRKLEKILGGYIQPGDHDDEEDDKLQ
jgi:RNA polymerase sigma-70 factor, ECF subfamily